MTRSRCRLAAISLLWSVVLSAAPGEQISGPSSVTSVGPATAYKVLPAAWLRLAVSFGPRGHALANSRAATIELTLPSDEGERLIGSVRIASASDLESATEAGRLTFPGVPTHLPMWLRISVRSKKDDAVVRTYARSYTLRFPAQARTAQIGLAGALEESGYLGDFVIDPVDDEITRQVSLQQGR